MYKYRIYGLSVLSDLQLDCFAGDFDTADIVIRFTKSEAEAERLLSQLRDKGDPIELKVSEGYGKFFICGTDNIIVFFQSEEYLQNFLVHCLLGFVFSYILIKRKIFFLHGSSIVFANNATAIIGRAGAGKSSLAAGLAQHGGKILADDMVRLELSSDLPYVYPGYPTRRLWMNAIEHLGIDTSNASKIIGENGKFSLNEVNQSVFLNQCVPIKSIIYLKPWDKNDVQLIKEDIKNSIGIINSNIYNNRLIVKHDFISDYFNFIVAVCERIPVYTLYRPADSFSVKEQTDVILKEFNNED